MKRNKDKFLEFTVEQIQEAESEYQGDVHYLEYGYIPVTKEDLTFKQRLKKATDGKRG